MLIISSKRELNFLIAAKSTKLVLLNLFLQFLNFIQLERPIDKKKIGTGRIINIEDRTIRGKDTLFKKQLKPNDVIKLLSTGKEIIIEKVIDNSTLVSKKTVELKLTGEETFHILPKINQERVFKNVFSELSKGKAIGIFPEGGSHDQPGLLPLKAGAAVFAWGCYKQYKQKVQMVEVGINYFGSHRFRSRVVINIGKPRTFNFDDNKLDDPEYKRASISSMMVDLKASLGTVKVTAPSYKELLGLYCAHKIYIPKDTTLETERDFRLFKRFSVAYEEIKDKEDVKELAIEVDGFRKKIKRFGLRVEEIKNIKLIFKDTIIIYIKKIIFLIILVG